MKRHNKAVHFWSAIQFLLQISMSTQPFSSPELPITTTIPNAEAADLTHPKPKSERESSLGKSKPLHRRPHTLNSNLEAYKSIKRTSQEKAEETTPPPYPRSTQQSGNVGTERFKKKALSKQEILELRGQTGEELEVNSVGEEQAGRKDEEASPKEINKKSKTQYFHIEDFQRHSSLAAQSQTLQQSDTLYIASLKQKCQSVDESNCLLQKRISWLREEVEMHLERQLSFQRTHEQLQADIQQKDQLIQEKDQLIHHKDQLIRQKEKQIEIHLADNKALQKQLHERDCQLERLKALIVDLHNRFEEEQEALIQQIDFLKNEREAELEELKRADEKVRDLQMALRSTQNHSQPTSPSEQPYIQYQSQQYSAAMEQLLSEIKYLRVENHVLVRSKDEVRRLQKEVKRIANQRDTFKKKIIEAVKRNHQLTEEDSDSSFFLSEISHETSSNH